jgi:3-hydroxy acid dehydrogenase / malonic semialdehyde reductase
MSSRLHGHTILITGASSGIGRSTALEFARTSPSSLRLILTARRLPALHQLAAEIKHEVGNGVKIHVAELDMTDFRAIDRFVENLPEEFRGVDCLVNNAYVSLFFLLFEREFGVR